MAPSLVEGELVFVESGVHRLNLFTYRELTKWLHNPMETPLPLPVAEQLTLVMS